MEKNEKYYSRLRDLREDEDLNQAQIAEILGLTNQQAYQRYESGRVELPMKYFIVLAKFYNVSLDYMAGLTNDKRGIGYKNQSNAKNKESSQDIENKYILSQNNEIGNYNITQSNNSGTNNISFKK